MAHEIEIDANGKASFFSGEGIGAWHGLGEVIQGLATSSEALEYAGLDWDVELRPVKFPNTANDGVLTVPDRFVVVRSTDEAALGVVGTDYKPVNNKEAFSFMDTLTDTGEAIYTTAGSLMGGKRVFMTAQIGDIFEVADNDKIGNFLCVTTSHDGTKSFQAFTTAIRIVCNNTLTLAVNATQNKWSMTHRQDIKGRAQEAREALSLSFKYKDAFEDEVKALLAVEVEKDDFKRIVESILPDQKRKKDRSVSELMGVFENEPTVTAGGGEGTGWAAMNAYTYWADWRKEFRNAEARSKSLTAGDVFKARNDVRDRILALA